MDAPTPTQESPPPPQAAHALAERLRRLTAEAEHNEAVMRRFQARELALLGAGSLASLLWEMTHGTREAFGLDNVGLNLVDGDGALAALCASGMDCRPVPETVRWVASPAECRVLATLAGSTRLEPHGASRHGELFPGPGPELASVALLPLRRGGALLGVLALGSADPRRYTPRHGVEFLDHLAAVAAVVLENASNRERLVVTGYTDPLTRLANRRFLERRLAEEMARAGRHGESLACLFVDVDHFKGVNDRYGHGVGDRVLQEVAQRVAGAARASDVVARYGGEEFALLLPETGLEEACRFAERVRQAVAGTPFSIPDAGLTEAVPVTVSVGVSALDRLPPAIPGQVLVEAADGALYRAKAGGRNRVEAAAGPAHRPANGALKSAGTPRRPGR